MPPKALPDIPVLYSAEAISAQVGRLARELAADLRGLDPVLIAVLRGSVVFLADLVRKLNFPLSVDYVAAASYEGTSSSGVVRLLKDVEDPIAGRHVVIVEDIVDSGLTLRFLVATLRARDPVSLRVCALLDKTGHRTVGVPIDYVGFRFETGFVVGYGMDYRQRFRNLPYVGLLTEEAETQVTRGPDAE